jgi:hypothetical protein
VARTATRPANGTILRYRHATVTTHPGLPHVVVVVVVVVVTQKLIVLLVDFRWIDDSGATIVQGRFLTFLLWMMMMMMMMVRLDLPIAVDRWLSSPLLGI